ncbi:MAG: molybdopterin-synthase adenylyltransferase MoeB [Thermoflexales bacterium]
MQTAANSLSAAELRRYARHLTLPEFGLEGQQKLRAASVLLVGLGGLGAPTAMYLAAAGVGRIGLVDYDVVDESNLQRQVIHGQSMLGKPKVLSAAARIHDINPYVEVVPYQTALRRDNALDIFRDYDVIVDGADNFATRYLVNDACVLLDKPNVHGSIFRFEGQVSVFWAKCGPCYRCLYPEPPPPGMIPSCAEAGVLGVLPGLIGLVQATETVKLIAGIGAPLIGRLLLYDALDMTFREVKLRKDPHCPICGEQPRITELIDYDEFCGTPGLHTHPFDTAAVPEITVHELRRRLESAELERTNTWLVDVREPYEWQIVHFPQARLIPMREVPQHLDELRQASELLVYCRSGARSAEVVRYLHTQGFKNAKNVRGGILAWAREIDPNTPVY